MAVFINAPQLMEIIYDVILYISNVLNLHLSIHEVITQCTAPLTFLSICSAGKLLSHVLQGGGRDRDRDRGGCRALWLQRRKLRTSERFSTTESDPVTGPPEPRNLRLSSLGLYDLVQIHTKSTCCVVLMIIIAFLNAIVCFYRGERWEWVCLTGAVWDLSGMSTHTTHNANTHTHTPVLPPYPNTLIHHFNPPTSFFSSRSLHQTADKSNNLGVCLFGQNRNHQKGKYFTFIHFSSVMVSLYSTVSPAVNVQDPPVTQQLSSDFLKVTMWHSQPLHAVIGQRRGGVSKLGLNFALKLSFSFLTQLCAALPAHNPAQRYQHLPGQTVWKCAPLFPYLNDITSQPSHWRPAFHSAFEWSQQL